MPDAHFVPGPEVGHGYRWLIAAAVLAVGTAFFGLWFWLPPGWLGFSVEMAGAARWRSLAQLPSACICLSCFMKSRRCAGSSGNSTKSIGGM